MKWLANNWLKLAAIVALAGAIWGNFPFAYYQLMNWIVVGASIVTAMQASYKNRVPVMWLFILVAVIFNPVAPFYLDQTIWRYVDMAAGGIFFVALFI